MPNLSIAEEGIFLCMRDSPKFAQEMGTKLFFSSILSMDYDGNCCYSFQKEGDFVQLSQLIQSVTNFLERKGLSITLDKKAHKLVDAIEKSEQQFQESRKRGQEILQGTYDKIEIPDFSRKLKPYQIQSVIHAIDCLFVANFSVPGSGKTTMAYATYSFLKKEKIVNKIVVIGPRGSFMPWEEEYQSCFEKDPDSFRIVDSKDHNLAEKVSKSELILLTYNMASIITNQLIEILSKYECLLILDESHHVKRFDGGVWANSVLKIAPFATRRLILTGTPMPNSLRDLWTQFTFLWPFKNLLGESLSYKWVTDEPNSLMNIREIIGPFYTRVTKSQLNLPDPCFKEIPVPLNRVQQSIYSVLATRMLNEFVNSPVDRMQLRDWRRAKIIRLMQAASNPSLLTEYSDEFKIPPLNIEGLSVVKLIKQYSDFEIPSKLVKANVLVRELLTQGEKVIVWEQFVHNIKTLGKMLDDVRPILIYGDIPRDENENEFLNREKSIREFKSSRSPRVIIANPMCLGEAVSLHKTCKHAIYVDRSFNAGQYIQSLDRIHRIGLKREEKVTYHVLIAKGTVDETINTRLKEKYERMLRLLNDDLSIMELGVSIDEISNKEFEDDFKAVQKHLHSLKMGECIDR